MIRKSPCKSNICNTGNGGSMDHHKSTTGPQMLQAADRSTRVMEGCPQLSCGCSEPQLIGVTGVEGAVAARCSRCGAWAIRDFEREALAALLADQQLPPQLVVFEPGSTETTEDDSVRRCAG